MSWICFTETIRKYASMNVTAGSLQNMYFLLGLCLIMSIDSLVSAQNKIKCFDNNRGRLGDKGGITLDCSNTDGNSNLLHIEEWIQYHAFFNDDVPTKRVLNINLENNHFNKLFTFPQINSLKKLSFKYNNISTIEKLALSNLPALEELDLSYNALNSKCYNNKYYFTYIML